MAMPTLDKVRGSLARGEWRTPDYLAAEIARHRQLHPDQINMGEIYLHLDTLMNDEGSVEKNGTGQQYRLI